MDAFVHSVETAGALDGPGLRYVLFLKGCPFRCKFCHNPDTWASSSGERRSLEGILSDILKYECFFKFTGGGVTVSGGEPLMQAKFVGELFKALKARGIHTCLDTCGGVDLSADVLACVENSDLIMLDIKHLDESEHKFLTGRGRAETMDFLQLLERLKKRVWIRIVMLRGLSSSVEYADRLANFLGGFSCVELVELLPYHTLGVQKWKALGLKYELGEGEIPTASELSAFESRLNARGIKTLLKS